MIYAPKRDEGHPRPFYMAVFQGVPVRMKQLFPSILCFCPNVCATSRQEALRSLLRVRKTKTTPLLCFSRRFPRSSRLVERVEQATALGKAHLFLSPLIVDHELPTTPSFFLSTSRFLALTLKRIYYIEESVFRQTKCV